MTYSPAHTAKQKKCDTATDDGDDDDGEAHKKAPSILKYFSLVHRTKITFSLQTRFLVFFFPSPIFIVHLIIIIIIGVGIGIIITTGQTLGTGKKVRKVSVFS